MLLCKMYRWVLHVFWDFIYFYTYLDYFYKSKSAEKYLNLEYANSTFISNYGINLAASS